MSELTIKHRTFEIIRPDRPLSEPDLVALEAKIHTRIPDQLRQFYLKWNGGLPYPSDIPQDESLWVRLIWKDGAQATAAGPASDFRKIFPINCGDQNLDFYRTWNDFKDRIPFDTACFSRDSGGSLYLIGTADENLGKIYFWARSYQAEVRGGSVSAYPNIAEVANSFEDLLLSLREEPQADETLEEWSKRVYVD